MSPLELTCSGSPDGSSDGVQLISIMAAIKILVARNILCFLIIKFLFNFLTSVIITLVAKLVAIMACVLRSQGQIQTGNKSAKPVKENRNGETLVR